MLSCRAIWSSNDENKINLIVNTRYQLDNLIASLPGVDFFISCITGTTTNTKNKESVRPGVAYFIAYQWNSQTNETSIFKCLHDSGLEATVNTLKTRSSKDEKQSLLQCLKQVVKVLYLYL